MNTSFPSTCFAIDDSNSEGAIKKAYALDGVQGEYGVKANIDLLLRGSDIITKLIDITGRPLFADLKANNGKRTMAEMVKEVADRGAKMVNLYVMADRLTEKALQVARDNNMISLGVTVTTHFDEAFCRKYFRRSLAETVKFLAEEALNLGFDGYILPGTTLKYVAGLGGFRFIPATRPTWYADKKTNDQEQECTPTDAILPIGDDGKQVHGADVVSCGSPVFKSPDPKEAAKRILTEVKKAWPRRMTA